MPLRFFQRGNLAEHARHMQLSSYEPSIQLDGLVPGVDNVRHDVALSPRFCEIARQHVFRLVAKYGQIEPLVADDALPSRPPSRLMLPQARGNGKQADASDFKRALLELHVAALNQAKAANNVSVDLLARLAAIKFQRNEIR